MEDMRRMRSEMQRPSAAFSLNKIITDDGFTDVFGGAPRSIFSHQLSASDLFYEDIFRQPAKAAAAPMRPRGRNLPIFDIPSLQQSSSDRCSRQKNGFFSDIFGWDAKKRSRSRSKTNSSSVLSSEELSPLHPPISDDDVAFLAAKPVNVKSNWNSSRVGDENHQKQPKSPVFSNFDCENEFLDKLWGCPLRPNSIDENIDIEQMNFRMSENDVQFNSPSSVVSSDRNVENCEIIDDEILMDDEKMELDDEIDEDELMSSYVIELDSCSRETSYKSTDVDEAIAWAKEKFQKHSTDQDKPTHDVMDECHISSGEMEEDDTGILDEKIRLWLMGKESDVRLLLSSLHHILWPNSGWMEIPLMKLMESSQVKKAYQKSILCLHPDKLQQRGATVLHKYIAEKAFAALQDAWTSFASQDVSCH